MVAKPICTVSELGRSESGSYPGNRRSGINSSVAQSSEVLNKAGDC